jgi:hypothetical protein
LRDGSPPNVVHGSPALEGRQRLLQDCVVMALFSGEFPLLRRVLLGESGKLGVGFVQPALEHHGQDLLGFDAN